MSYSISLQHGRLQDRYIVVVGQFSSSYKVQLNYLYKLHPVFSELELSGKSLPLPGRPMMGKSPDYQGVPPSAGAPCYPWQPGCGGAPLPLPSCQPWPRCLIPRLRKMTGSGKEYQAPPTGFPPIGWRSHTPPWTAPPCMPYPKCMEDFCKPFPQCMQHG